jgi:galactan endo-1,6-beta-galactosidase
VVRRRSVLAAALTGPLAAAWPAAARADFTTTPDPETDWGAWEGWGTSLSWWGNVFGDRDDVADALFTTGDVTIAGASVPGLGMTIVRYNAGACTAQPVAGGATMVASPNIPAFKQMQGYWLNWNSSDPASASWNWYADSNQRNALWRARDRGVTNFELFSVSPMWWMCYNSNPSGAANGGNNLQSWNYGQHAVYLATVARFARDNWGFHFTSVEAFNEPSVSWKADGNQEGCHLDPAVQAQVIPRFAQELSNRGLSPVLSASDETSYDQAHATWAALGSAQSHVDKINVHGYQYENGRRDLVYADAKAAGKRLWNSEYGDGDATGLRMAINLNLDMRWLHPTAWVYWQALDGSTWGMVSVDEPGATLGAVQTKYYVMAQYSRHIRPGMRIIDSGEANTVAAYDQTQHRLVLVSLNRGDGQYIGYDLTRFGRVAGSTGGLVHRWTTDTTAGGQRYAYHADTTLHGTQFWSWFNPGMVQTFQVDNVDI